MFPLTVGRLLSTRRRRRLVVGVSLSVTAVSVVGLTSVGAAVDAHAQAWNGYRASQASLVAARQSHDAAVADLAQARASALAAFASARDLHDQSTAHGVLLTAAAQVARLGDALTTFTTATGIDDASPTATAADLSPLASAAQTLNDRSGTSALSTAADASDAEVENAADEARDLAAQADAITSATAALQSATVAAADAQHVPVTGRASGTDPHCASVADGVRTVWVSIADQHLWACDGSHLKIESAVTTGATAITNVDDSTPTGTFSVLGKMSKTVLRGSDANGSWTDPVTSWIPFADGIGFHDASWQTFPYGAAQYTTEGSHGCVHTPTDVLAVLSSWLHVGDRVVVG